MGDELIEYTEASGLEKLEQPVVGVALVVLHPQLDVPVATETPSPARETPHPYLHSRSDPVRPLRSATIGSMDWVCEYCGDEGTAAEPAADIDELQCPSCGEPVTAR